MELYLSLGSNLGNRKENILKAVSMLEDELGVPCARMSRIEESESWGFDGPAFLDCAVCFDIPFAGFDAGDVTADSAKNDARFGTDAETASRTEMAGTMDPERRLEAILDVCKAIERRLGRDDAPEYGPDGRRIYHSRTVDIDILFFGTMAIQTDRLTVPHRLIAQREFVKKPLREIVSERMANYYKDILE